MSWEFVPTFRSKHNLKLSKKYLPSSQLTAADVNYTTVQPLVRKYTRQSSTPGTRGTGSYAWTNLACVYACFVVRSHFLAQSAADVAHASTMMARAALCELLAMKLARFFANDSIALARALTACWVPTAGAPPEVLAEIRDAVGGAEVGLEDPNCALEVRLCVFSRREPSRCRKGFDVFC